MNPNDISLERTLLSDALHRSPGVAKNELGPLLKGKAPHRPNVVQSMLGSMPKGKAPHHPNVVTSMLGAQHALGRAWRASDARGIRIRLGSWNIGTLTGKLRELADTFARRRVNIACLQETKWVGTKAKEVEGTDFKLWYTGISKGKNGVGIMIDKNLKDGVVDVKRVGDRIILVKLVVEDTIMNVLSVYAPQIGLHVSEKRQFWEDLEDVLRGIPREEKLFIGGDLNGHVGQCSGGFERVHGGFGFGIRNEAGSDILNVALAYDLMLTNTFFRKRTSHLTTFRSGHNCSQIDTLPRVTGLCGRNLSASWRVTPVISYVPDN